MKKLIIAIMAVLSLIGTNVNAKTLVVYYSFTNNVRTIVSSLDTKIQADVVEVQPAEEGLDYAANNYAIGSRLIAAIRNNPNDASSYPAIKPTGVNVEEYDYIIVATPLWWSQMAAPMQTFLFENGNKMAGKTIALIVSSASSSISSTVADAKRLIPGGVFVEPNLWIRSAQVSNASAMLDQWLNDIHYNSVATVVDTFSDNHGDDGRMFDLQGRLLQQEPDAGIFIKGGKKILK